MRYAVYLTHIQSLAISLISNKALHHPYFEALPYPTHPSKLPKCAETVARHQAEAEEAAEEVTNAANAGKMTVNKINPNRLKRKLMSPTEDGKTRTIARKLDFSKAINSP